MLRAMFLSTVFAVGVVGAARAAVVGTSSGTFNDLGQGNSCDGEYCAITNGRTQVRWGSDSIFSNNRNPSTLTANPTSINLPTNAGTGVLGQLTWFNNDTLASQTPDSFAVDWLLSIAFTQPNASSDSEEFDLTITNTPNNPADNIVGLTLTDLNNLSFTLNGVTISNLRYAVADVSGPGGTSLQNVTGGVRWVNDEGNTARLQILADFTPTAVPAPASLALFGAGLFGLGFARRRRGQQA